MHCKQIKENDIKMIAENNDAPNEFTENLRILKLNLMQITKQIEEGHDEQKQIHENIELPQNTETSYLTETKIRTKVLQLNPEESD